MHNTHFNSDPIQPDDILGPNDPIDSTSGQNKKFIKNDASDIIAHWFDEMISIPGTNIKIGLDSVLAFFPGVGSLIASFSSLIIVIESIRLKIPKKIIFSMLVNIGINAIFDFFPVIAPFLTMFFRSNSRNLLLLRQWQEGNVVQAEKTASIYLFSMMSVVIAFVIFVSVTFMSLIYFLVKLIRKIID
jgi:hypothetical protein